MFLPENYEAPRSSSDGYMKLQDGENKIRILSSPIIGWEDWTPEKKPVRFRYHNKPEKSIDPKKPLKHFWSMIVWNYNEEKIQVLHITQATIRKSLEKLCKDADWGAPFFYDIKICKEGEQKDTEYTVNPLPHKQVSEHIVQEFKNKPCYLEALFDNLDPFDAKWGEHTPGVFAKDDAKIVEIKKQTITQQQAGELETILYQCDPKYKQIVLDALNNQKIVKLIDLPVEMYGRLKSAAEKNAETYINSQTLPF